MAEQTIILASGSPRRKEILTLMGISFCVDVPDVAEDDIQGSAEDVVQALARRKADAVARRHPGRIVLAADTVVLCDRILGKPRTSAEAASMLRALSDRWHEVFTGVCVLAGENIRCESACTRVHFTPLTDSEIEAYVRTGDAMDKAGAYAIQGMSGMFIDRIEGCPHNVMGLPMALTKRLLSDEGASTCQSYHRT